MIENQNRPKSPVGKICFILESMEFILAEGAIALSVTLSGGALFAS